MGLAEWTLTPVMECTDSMGLRSAGPTATRPRLMVLERLAEGNGHLAVDYRSVRQLAGNRSLTGAAPSCPRRSGRRHPIVRRAGRSLPWVGRRGERRSVP